jgi:hypothetical protein
MSEVMDVINAFGTPLKLAWVGWMAWGVGQYFWFRYERATPVKRVTSVAKPVAAKKPAVPKTVAVQAAEAPVVGRLFTPTHVTADVKPSQPSAVEATQVRLQPAGAAPMPMTVAATDATVPALDPSKAVAAFDPTKAVAAFDPTKAVIEQFGATNDDVLDKFVRDFEMQDARPRRRKPAMVPETPSYGAEAPHAR